MYKKPMFSNHKAILSMRCVSSIINCLKISKLAICKLLTFVLSAKINQILIENVIKMLLVFVAVIFASYKDSKKY